MSAKRKAPTMAEKLAATLLEYQRLRGDPIDREHAKMMHAEQICSLFEFDHDSKYHCDGADNHPTILTPLLIGEHHKKTGKDIRRIKKTNRLAAGHQAHAGKIRAKILGNNEGENDGRDIGKAAKRQRPKHRWPKGQKLRSAGFPKGEERERLKERARSARQKHKISPR